MWADEDERTIVTAFRMIREANEDEAARSDEGFDEETQMSG